MSANVVENYGWATNEQTQSHDYITPGILKSLSKLSANKVIDIGCGNGVLCRKIHESGYKVAGVEYDKTGCEIASSSTPEINFYNLGVQDCPNEMLEKEGRFDVVVSTEVIEHLFSPHLLPIFSHKVLVNGGYLVITTPYHGYIKNLLLSLANKWDFHHNPLWHGGHIKFWSKNTLSCLLRENGFKVVSFSGLGRAPFLWKSMIVIAQKI